MKGTRFIIMPKQRFAGWCEAKKAGYKCITQPGAAVLSISYDFYFIYIMLSSDETAALRRRLYVI
jgi:hypothetical protein